MHFLLITHSLATVAALANALPWLYKLIILIMLGYSLFVSVRRYYSHFQSYQIKHSGSFGWQLATTVDDFQTLQILPSTVITVWMIVLHFRLENGKFQSLVILNDALTEQNYRALVVTLKITH